MLTRDYQRTTGLDLKLARVARGVAQRAIAWHLGVSPQRISAIEATYWPTARTAARYLDALGAIVGTSPAPSPSTRTERGSR
jgi:transcriptional regulator with XRE-family HTH domain